MFRVDNLNQMLILMSQEIIKNGVPRKTRGFDCIEIPHPVLIEMQHPCDRYVTIPERKWNKYLGFVESLWLASGTNHMELPGSYVSNMYNFSDDGKFMRAGYGPRIRTFNGIAKDYECPKPLKGSFAIEDVRSVDQLKFVIDTLKKDINSRQALITIHDPVKDDYTKDGDLKVTKDQPCSRSLQFMVVDGKLNLTSYMRSNDLIWGLSAVNVFNFCFMQEYVAMMLNIPVGKYYHFVNNLHVYENFLDMVKTFASYNVDDFKTKEVFYYRDRLPLKDFDNEVTELFHFEESLRENYKTMSNHYFNLFDFFSDWGNVFIAKKKKIIPKFKNDLLNNLFLGE